MIANCGSDERGKFTGGKAGDQTKEEFKIRGWYNRPWGCVLRHPDFQVRDFIASVAETLANNDAVGYDYGNDRYTLMRQLEATEWHPELITVPCETDCSNAVTAEVKCAGHRLGRPELANISERLWTGDLRQTLEKVGFEVLTDKKYLTSAKYLLRGDILLVHTDKAKHAATNLTDGSEAKKDMEKVTTPAPAPVEPPKSAAPEFKPYLVKVSITNLRIRTAPGTNQPCLMNNGKEVTTGIGVFTIVGEAQGEGSKSGWGKLKSGAGWISLDFTKRM